MNETTPPASPDFSDFTGLSGEKTGGENGKEDSGENNEEQNWAPSIAQMTQYLSNPQAFQDFFPALRAKNPEPPAPETPESPGATTQTTRTTQTTKTAETQREETGKKHSYPPEATSPFVEFTRESWSALAPSTPLPLSETDIAELRATGDPIDAQEADVVYRPLSALLQLYVGAKSELCAKRRRFLSETETARAPFIIGIAGSVAVGKTTVSRLLQKLLSRWPSTPQVELVTTDGFLYPNRELISRGIMHRKGFPESYDRRALLRFLTQVKSGFPCALAPVYSHTTYDIIPGKMHEIRRPDILIVEGVNVLQPAGRAKKSSSSLTVYDFFDFSIYVEARTSDVEQWYLERFEQLRRTAFLNPSSFFRAMSQIPPEEARAQARKVWREVNLVNLVENIAPTRGRADLIITKDHAHRVHRMLLRKL